MKIFLSLLCLAASARAQFNNAPQAPPFAAQLYNLAAPDSGKSRLLVSLTVLYDDLSFAKSDSGFGAEYELALEITNAAGDRVAGREEKRRLHVRSFEETNSRKKYGAHDYQFDLPPGKRRVAFNFVDRVSGATSRSEIAKELRAFSGNKNRLALSDLVLLDQLATDSLQRTVIAPGLYQNTTTPEGKLHVYWEMFSADMSAPLLVRQIIRNWQRQIVLDQTKEWTRRGPLEQAVLPIWIDALPYGAYEIEMKVRQGKTEKTARESFHLTWNGIPDDGVHLDQALRVAQYIAAPHEREQLQAALRDYSKEQKRELLRAFWETRDDSPNTPELEAMNTYYQRVEFANEKFSAGKREGWQTDFGKIFVTYGAPDSVELVDANSHAAQILVWHYRRFDRQFSFVDRHGTGDYRLLSH
jgi:GWxTD domain-containing protein